MVKKAIDSGKLVIGVFSWGLPPYFIETFGWTGFDFVIIDTEHRPVNNQALEDLVRAAYVAKITPIVRVAENSRMLITAALDAGAKGIIVPHVKSKEDATNLVQVVKYNPEGERGTCRWTLPAMRWKFSHKGVDWRSYFTQANEETMAIPLVEEEEGIRNLEDILSVKGLDFIFLGSGDLSMSLGCFGDYESEAVKRHMEKGVTLCKEKKVPVAALASRYDRGVDIEYSEKLIGMGVNILVFMDIGIFEEGCRKAVETVSQLRKIDS